ncbi:MAG: glycosyltransferase family 87 protein, partial [Corynebacterium matruchotii]
WWAGVILGLAIMIKPVFLPLLVLPLVKFQWRTILVGVGLPAALNAVAWLVVPGAGEYVSRTMPYLKQVRDYANSSLPGLVTYFGLPGWVGTVLFLVLAAVVVAGVWFLLRLRHSDPLLWACATSGLLLSGAFLLSSLGQMYYSMMLFPLVATVVLRRSPMHSAAGAVGMVLCLSPLEWEFARWPVYGQWLDTFLPTVGWLCVVVATAMFGFQAFRRPPSGE